MKVATLSNLLIAFHSGNSAVVLIIVTEGIENTKAILLFIPEQKRQQ